MKRLLFFAAVALLVFSGVYGEEKIASGKKYLNKPTPKLVNESAAPNAAMVQ